MKPRKTLEDLTEGRWAGIENQSRQKDKRKAQRVYYQRRILTIYYWILSVKHCSKAFAGMTLSNLQNHPAVKVKSLSCVQLFATPWTIAHPAPLSMGLSQQEYWSGLPFPPPGDLLDAGIEHESLTSPALAVSFFTTCATWEVLCVWLFSCSVVSDSLWLHGLQHARLPCPSPSPGACSNLCPLSQWCHPAISTPSPAFNLYQHQDLF